MKTIYHVMNALIVVLAVVIYTVGVNARHYDTNYIQQLITGICLGSLAIPFQLLYQRIVSKAIGARPVPHHIMSIQIVVSKMPISILCVCGICMWAVGHSNEKWFEFQFGCKMPQNTRIIEREGSFGFGGDGVSAMQCILAHGELDSIVRFGAYKEMNVNSAILSVINFEVKSIAGITITLDVTNSLFVSFTNSQLRIIQYNSPSKTMYSVKYTGAPAESKRAALVY